MPAAKEEAKRPCPRARPCVGLRMRGAECASGKNSRQPMQTLQRKRCQTRARSRKKACVYGVRVLRATIFGYVGGNPLNGIDPDGLNPFAVANFVTNIAMRGYGAAQTALYRYAPALTELVAGASGVNGAVVSPISPLVAQIPTAVSRMTPVARAVAEGIESGGFCSANGGRVLEYADRIRPRVIADPGGHNFPFSFDEAILATQPVIVRGGGDGHALRGFKNDSDVIYNIIVKNGEITHRDLVAVEKWAQRSKSFGWGQKVEEIPR